MTLPNAAGVAPPKAVRIALSPTARSGHVLPHAADLEERIDDAQLSARRLEYTVQVELKLALSVCFPEVASVCLGEKSK